jgi:DNA-binding response OmpR family regulator
VSPRILLVDDEATLRKTLERALSNFGYEVFTAPDAHSAYALLSETPFDLVLLDLRMPHMAGDALYLAIVRRWPEMQGPEAVYARHSRSYRRHRARARRGRGSAPPQAAG